MSDDNEDDRLSPHEVRITRLEERLRSHVSRTDLRFSDHHTHMNTLQRQYMDWDKRLRDIETALSGFKYVFATVMFILTVLEIVSKVYFNK